MASSEVSEVLYHEDDICMAGGLECVQEVVTDSAFPLDGQIIYGDELIVTSEDVPQSEEIVGCVSEDPLVGLYDGVPVPVPCDDDLRRLVRKSKHNHQQKRPIKSEFYDDYETKIRNSHGTWQQKQVSIKTLEGEFSVTMWASGADEGVYPVWIPFFIGYFCYKRVIKIMCLFGGVWRAASPAGSRDNLAFITASTNHQFLTHFQLD